MSTPGSAAARADQAARARLPVPTATQVYGFFPALALGGIMAPEYLRCVALREHLIILRQA